MPRQRLRRLGGLVLVVGMSALGMASTAVPGTSALRRYRDASRLPALASAPLADADVAVPVGTSSAVVHGTRSSGRKVVRTNGMRTLAAPPGTTAVAPVDGAVVTTLTPTLTVNAVTDPDGDPVTYRFKVTTRADAETGMILADTSVTATSLVVPDGALQDGLTYYWHTYVADPSTPSGTAPGWVRSFRVDLGLGERTTLPSDTEGPARVNVANGNLVVTARSATVASVAGPVGVELTYNGHAPAPTGLIGTYTADLNANHVVDGAEAPAVVRRDPSVAFDWGTSPLAPGLPATNVIARWEGRVTIPVTGDYLFGATTSDGVRISIDGSLVVDSWSTHVAGAPIYGSSASLTAGTSVPIVVDWFKGATAGAVLKLYVMGTGATTLAEALVPPSWLAPDAGPLPTGWTMAATGGGLPYLQAVVSDTRVVLVGRDGDTHVYTSTGSGYSPPLGETGVLARDANGLLTLEANGGTYGFGPSGNPASATTRATMPASHGYGWTAPSVTTSSALALPRLTAIDDPVSGRHITLRYGAESGCPAGLPSGFDSAAPAGMLCAVELWDGRVTELWYVDGRLARVVNPGAEVTDFAYDGSGRLAKVRDPLAADLVADAVRADDDTTRTLVAYDGSGRVLSVTLGEPTSGADRPQHSYGYVSATQVNVHVAGLTEALGWARKVTLDARGRLLTDTDATNRVTSSAWDTADRLVATVDTAGLQRTTIYDTSGRATDTYGPAPSAWFGVDNRPLAAFVATTPHETAAYDQGMSGLDGVYWANPTWSGAPATRSFPAGDSSGSVNALWSSPPAGLPAGTWSARFAGEITMGAAGSYLFNANPDGRVWLYVDDVLVLDSSLTATATYANAIAGAVHRVRVDYTTAGASMKITTFAYTGGSQSLVVPTGVTSLYVDAKGAQGGAGGTVGGAGARVQATMPVTGGETLTVKVGGQGLAVAPPPGLTRNAGGYNGGGAGGLGNSQKGASGGGSSDLLRGATRLVVAGGGGGAGQSYVIPGGTGGQSGSTGGTSPNRSAGGGGGATPSAVGAAGTTASPGINGTAGVGAVGGQGGDVSMQGWNPGGGGGGGGGWFGGGGGASAAEYAESGGGGGGSSNVAAGATGVAYTSGYRTGHGSIVFEWLSAGPTPSVDLHWTPPAGSDVRVPGSALRPAYRLVTAVVDADGKATSTELAHPELRLPTASVVDPSGLNLRTVTAYDAQYQRVSTRDLPKGSATRATTTYYGATEARVNPCDSGSTAVIQGGLAKTTAAADPDGGGAQAPVVHEVVYDGGGNVVASRVVGDSGWSCTTYDDRSQVLTSADRAGGTTTINRSLAGAVVSSFPDSSGASRSTTTVVDLLGRTVSYTDELGTVTRTVRDRAGRQTATYRTLPADTEVQVTSATYDDADRVLTRADLLSGSSRTTTFQYDTAGRLTTTVLPNGMATTRAYDAEAGRLVSIVDGLAAPTAQSVSFEHAGGPQQFVVPFGVTSITVDAAGGQGGSGGGTGGNGARVQATVPVIPGETLGVMVGGQGLAGAFTAAFVRNPGGFNGGGDSGMSRSGSNWAKGPSGGGASDLRRGATRLVAAGGGGGAGQSYVVNGGAAGQTGVTGGTSPNRSAGGGAGATQSAAGAAGTITGAGGNGLAGSGGIGGRGGDFTSNGWNPGGGGGGGGGWFGGGGGAASAEYAESGGGGGGSSGVATGVTGTTYTSAYRSGHGRITISWIGYPITSQVIPGSGTHTFVVPPGVSSLSVDVQGAQGGTGVTANGGAGGRVQTTIPVTAGETLTLVVGGKGLPWVSSSVGNPQPGGFNGGGTGGQGIYSEYRLAPTGGGSTDVRRGATRLVVAGGGGGAAHSNAIAGGAGGQSGANGGTSASYGAGGGVGATQSAVGAGGTVASGGNGSAGSGSTGGAGGVAVGCCGQNPGSGGGGGGGWFGGGGGASAYQGNEGGGGGGGSSGVAAGATGTTYTSGYRIGDGYAVLTWTRSSAALLGRGYTYSLAGRLIGESGARSRTYTYDGAGRLTTTVEGATTRRYAYDGDSNRCGLVVSCESSWTRDDADRLTASAYASGYLYDSHGNVTQALATSQSPGTQTLSFTGSAQTFVVPSGVTSLSVDVQGAQGGDMEGYWLNGVTGGKGGRVQGVIPVTPGETLTIDVGGAGSYQGPNGIPVIGPGGFNGGGDGGTANGGRPYSFGGGGASDVRRGGSGLVNRVVVAGGGGGAVPHGAGGDGGLPATAGVAGNDNGVAQQWAGPGGAGTASAGGAAGTAPTWYATLAGNAGALGQGGAGNGTTSQGDGGGGGGGGWYGGGGGGGSDCGACGGGGGGGSSYATPAATGVTHTTGQRTGDGQVVLSWGQSVSIGYDVDDHAVSVNDGTTTINETLAPDGRVLRRVVTTNATSVVVEDVSFGYAGPGDTSAYSQPTGGGAVTTYLPELGGLVDVGGTGTWSFYDRHGDVEATTNAAAAFTTVSMTDEFGVGSTPSNRLGWLGRDQRRVLGGTFSVLRLGGRLYAPPLGRFLQPGSGVTGYGIGAVPYP